MKISQQLWAGQKSTPPASSQHLSHQASIPRDSVLPRERGKTPTMQKALVEID